MVALLPTDHEVADDVIRGADLSMVYGGDDVMKRYAGRPTTLAQGPGRSKVLVTGADWHSRLDTIVTSISGFGGTACVNATAVFVDGDPAPVAQALAERLSLLPSLPPQDPKAVLPVQSTGSARGIEQHLLSRLGGFTALLGGPAGIVDELGDGSAVLRPAVMVTDRPDAPQTAVELPFPCVWVVPWSRDMGIGPLKNTLTLTVLASSADDELIEQLVDEPTISNVHIGDHPTHWMDPRVPHDSYLAEFLMRTKTVIRG